MKSPDWVQPRPSAARPRCFPDLDPARPRRDVGPKIQIWAKSPGVVAEHARLQSSQVKSSLLRRLSPPLLASRAPSIGWSRNRLSVIYVVT